MDSITQDLITFLNEIKRKTPNKYSESVYIVNAKHENDHNIGYEKFIFVDPQKITKMIDHLSAPKPIVKHELPIVPKPSLSVNINELKALSGCNYVTFRDGPPGCLRLALVQWDRVSVNYKINWSGDIYFNNIQVVGFLRNPGIGIRSCACCNPGSQLTLPDVKNLDYWCGCKNLCACTILRIPRKFSGTSLAIYRNGGEAFMITSQKEYEDYVGFKAFYTFDPAMIFRTSNGLGIYYEKYYNNLFGTKYCNVQFRISTSGVITKSSRGIPLVAEVIKDFGLKEYEYHFCNFKTLESDTEQIQQVIPDGSILKLIKDTIKPPPRFDDDQPASYSPVSDDEIW